MKTEDVCLSKPLIAMVKVVDTDTLSLMIKRLQQERHSRVHLGKHQLALFRFLKQEMLDKNPSHK